MGRPGSSPRSPTRRNAQLFETLVVSPTCTVAPATCAPSAGCRIVNTAGDEGRGALPVALAAGVSLNPLQAARLAASSPARAKRLTADSDHMAVYAPGVMSSCARNGVPSGAVAVIVKVCVTAPTSRLATL